MKYYSAIMLSNITYSLIALSSILNFCVNYSVHRMSIWLLRVDIPFCALIRQTLYKYKK